MAQGKAKQRGRASSKGASRPLCKATSKGTDKPCKNKAQSGSEYCNRHNPDNQEQIRKDQAKGGKAYGLQSKINAYCRTFGLEKAEILSFDQRLQALSAKFIDLIMNPTDDATQLLLQCNNSINQTLKIKFEIERGIVEEDEIVNISIGLATADDIRAARNAYRD